MTIADFLIAGGAALVAGAINAVAGGGTLVSFPALVLLGLPAITANATNTVALSPGYFGGALAQRTYLVGQRRRVRVLGMVSAVGGLIGSVLLIAGSEEVFAAIVPYLILAACALLGLQDWLRTKLRIGERAGSGASPGLVAGTLAAAVYGGYFGAGLGIMLLAILGLLLDERLAALNALKSVLSLVINLVAAVYFAFSGQVVWGLVAIMAVAALVGGHAGGLLASRLHPGRLRLVVIAFGVVVAVQMLVG